MDELFFYPPIKLFEDIIGDDNSSQTAGIMYYIAVICAQYPKVNFGTIRAIK